MKNLYHNDTHYETDYGHGDHGAIPTKRNASNLSKRSLEEELKNKIKKKSSISDVASKNLKLEKEKDIGYLKSEKSSSRNTNNTDKKVNIKTKSEVSNNYKKNAAPIATFKNKINVVTPKSKSNTLISKERIDTKKVKVILNSNNVQTSQKIIEKHNKSEVKSLKTATNSSSKKTTQIPFSIKDKVSKELDTSINTNADSNLTTERPGTATLLEGTIDNKEKIGPDTSSSIELRSNSNSSEEQENYEDDFESYESDFEEYSSSSSTNLMNLSANNSSLSSFSEEILPFENKISKDIVVLNSGDEDKNLDSGHFDMPGYKHRPMLDNIKEGIEKENININILSPTNSASLTDEGFEDHKSIQFVNFLDAQIKNNHKRNIHLRQKRGEEILSMVRLDYFNFTLIDLAPVSYELYIKNFGARNTIQTASQTGDDCIDEEIQTNEISCLEKCTQQPEVFLNNYPKSDNDILDAASKKAQKSVNSHSLNKFLISSCDIILKILEENNVAQFINPIIGPFSESIEKFKTDTNIFLETQVTHIFFPNEVSDTVITVHARHEESIIAMWNIYSYEEPELLYISYGVITYCCFGVVRYELIFAGLENGTITIWSGIKNSSNPDSAHLFSTGIKSGHQAKIIGLHFLGTTATDHWNTQQTNELCSLDEIGEIILWTIVIQYSEDRKYDKTDQVALIKNATISLKNLCPNLVDLQCTDFCSNILNPYYLFISTNYGIIIHYVLKSGVNRVKHFSSEIQSYPKSLESCPFSSEYFVAGYDNGNIGLFARSSDKPLMILSEKDKMESFSIELIQWSKNKSTMIYSKDSKNNINIWDLDESDMLPVYSIPYKEQITCMKISSPSEGLKSKKSFMLIGTTQGNLFLHQLGEELDQESELYKHSIKTFLNYVKRL